MKLGDNDRHESFHWMASEKAENAADYYHELGVPELATIWVRTAGLEALETNSNDMIDKAIELLTKSAEGFKEANEQREAFEDLFTVFETRFLNIPDKKRPINKSIKMMEDIATSTQDEILVAIASLARALNSGNHIGALMILQENEEDLLSKAERIRSLIEHSKVVRKIK